MPAICAEREASARQFLEFWRGSGYEKGQTQPFWLHLLRVLGVPSPESAIESEDKAHQENDRAVMVAYGFPVKMAKSECVAELFTRYQALVATEKGVRR